MQEQFELTVSDLAVQLVDRGGFNAHQHIIRTHLRFGHVGQTQGAFLLVFVDDKGFHGGTPAGNRDQAARKAKAFGTNCAWY